MKGQGQDQFTLKLPSNSKFCPDNNICKEREWDQSETVNLSICRNDLSLEQWEEFQQAHGRRLFSWIGRKYQHSSEIKY